MIHIFAIWDRAYESDYQEKQFPGNEFLRITSVPAGAFLQHPHVPDSCDGVFLIGTRADRSFYKTAEAVREHYPNLPLCISTTAEGMDAGEMNETNQNLPVDLWVLRTPEEDVFSERLWQRFAALSLEMQKKSEEDFGTFKTIDDRANHGIFITDPDLNIVYVNACCAATYRYSQKELIAKNIGELSQFSPGELADIKQRLSEERQPKPFEWKAIRKDGTIIPVQVSLQVLSEEEGTPLFVSGIVVDKTEIKKAEQEHEICRYSLENATDEVYWILRDGRYYDANKEACRMLGYTREELCTLSVFDINPDFSKDDWEAHWQNLRENQNIRTESRHLTKEGKIYPVEISANYFRNGECEFNCAFVRDITPRKQVEHELQKSEEKLRLKLDSILSPEYAVEETEFRNIIDSDAVQSLMDDFYRLTNIGIGIIDLQGTILVATGWQDICMNYHRVNPETQKNCFESDRVLSKDMAPGEVLFHKCKNNMWDGVTPIYIGEKHMGNLFLGQFFYDDEEVDTRVFAEQAERYGFDKEAYLAALDRVPRWSHEKVQTAMVFYQKFARMISDLSYSNIKLATLVEHHKQTEEKLIQSEQKYRGYIDTSPEGVFVTDAEGHYIEVNRSACDLIGYTEDELLAMNIAQLVLPEDFDRAHKIFQNLQETGQIYTETRLLKKDGSVCTVNLNAIVLPNGTPLGFVSDISERKQAEERILHLNRLLGAIRNVNLLIVHEKDPRTLIKKACDILTRVGGYQNAWIILFDRDGTTQYMAASNRGDQFRPMYEYLEKGNFTTCARKAIKTPEIVVTSYTSTPCTGCPLCRICEGGAGLTKRLESYGTIYGIISASVSAEQASDTEELDLFAEVAGDLAFSLYSIELEEKRRTAEEEILEKNTNLAAAYQDLAAGKEKLRENLSELVESQQELRETERRLSQIIEFLPDATFAIDMNGRVIAWNKALTAMTGISASEMLSMGDYEYGFRVYGKRGPILIDYMLHPELRDTIEYPTWSEEGDTLVAENYVPHLYENRGAHVWFTACCLYDSEGNVTGAIESIRDITAMKEAEQQILAASHTLKERVKELTCLREISDFIFKKPSGEELFQSILPLIQAAMQYPEDTAVSVDIDGHDYQTENYDSTSPSIEQKIFRDAEAIGKITVSYRNGHHEGDTHSFLPEEEWLLKIISERIDNYLSRQSAEVRIRESEEKFRELFNNMSSGVAVYDVTGNGSDFIIRDINKASEVIDHIRREDVVGKSIFAVFPGIETFGLPAVLQRVHKTGIPELFPLTEYKDEHIQGWRENYVYRLPSGEIVAVYDDQTEKKRAEEALIENEHKYHEIFNNINEAVFLHEVMADNTRGHFVEVNDVACHRLGYTREELLNRTVADINTGIIRKEDHNRVLELQTGNEISFDAEQVRKDGTIFPVHVNARMIYLRDHQFILSLVRDLTEEREAREREAIALQQIEENLMQLGTLNDEIRNPLMVISGIIGFSDKEISEPILKQVMAIDDIVHRLDQGWLESEKIREYLRKHHGII